MFKEYREKKFSLIDIVEEMKPKMVLVAENKQRKIEIDGTHILEE
jgi:hypothetical protein